MSKVQQALRVLPADVYDALELSALAFGGIGADFFGHIDGVPAGNVVATDPSATPCCIHGHAMFAEGASASGPRLMLGALYDAEIHYSANDEAVGDAKRISFSTWCKRLNVTRGT